MKGWHEGALWWNCSVYSLWWWSHKSTHVIKMHRTKYTHISACSVQSLSHVRLFATPWTAAPQASLSFTVSRSLLKLMSFEPMMPLVWNIYYKIVSVLRRDVFWFVLFPYYRWRLGKTFMVISLGFWTLCSGGCVFPFLPCLSLLFFFSCLWGLLRQPLCLFAFLFLWDGFGHCLLYSVMNLHP